MKSIPCNQVDFSPCMPDNPEPPTCKLGHGFSSDCLTTGGKCKSYKAAKYVPFDKLTVPTRGLPKNWRSRVIKESSNEK